MTMDTMRVPSQCSRKLYGTMDAIGAVGGLVSLVLFANLGTIYIMKKLRRAPPQGGSRGLAGDYHEMGM